MLTLYFGLFIFNSNHNSSDLTVLLSHYFTIQPTPLTKAFIIQWDNFFYSCC